MSVAGLHLLAALALCADHAQTSAAPHLNLEIAVSDEGRHLDGRASFPLAAGEHYFYLDAKLKLTSVKLDEMALATPPTQREVHGITQWAFVLERAGRLSIEYAGELAIFDSAIDHRRVMQVDQAMSNADWAWLPASAYWHPTPEQGLSGYTLAVRPHRGLAVTAGQYQALDDGRMEFQFGSPVAGLDVLIGPYERSQSRLELEGGNPVEVLTYFTPTTQDLAASYLSAASTHIRRYSEQIAPYPFSSFTMVASPLPSGFGMPGLTWLGESVLRLPFIPSTSLRHEVLHNWWGNGVRVDYQRGNWSEGLTTLMADFAAKLEQDPKADERQRVAWIRDQVAVPRSERTSLREFRSRTHGRLAAVGYSRAAFLLWMLSRELGEQPWRDGLKRFWKDCRDKRAGWDDLHASMKGQDNGPVWRHFATWLDQSDLPKLELLSAEAMNAERTEVQLRIQQSGSDVELRVPIYLATEGELERHDIDLTTGTGTYALMAKAPVLSVSLDPHLEVLRETLEDELPPVLRNFSLAADATVILASPGEEWRRAAEQLSGQFFERPAKVIDIAQTAHDTTQHGPWLVVGNRTDVQAFLSTQNLNSRLPVSMASDIHVAVWALPEASPRPVAIIAAPHVDDILPLIRRLPHYGGESYLGFRAGELVDRGAWPVNPQQLKLVKVRQ